jgi:hypothetical protein
MTVPTAPAPDGIRIDREAFDKATSEMKDAAGSIAHDDYPTDEHMAALETCSTRFRVERDALRATLRGLDKAIVDDTVAIAIAHARDQAKAKAARSGQDFDRMLRVIGAQQRQTAIDAERITVHCPICRCRPTVENLPAHVASHLAGVPSCDCAA